MSEVFIVMFQFEQSHVIETLAFSTRKKALRHINSAPRTDSTYFTIQVLVIDKEKACDTK